MKNQKNPDFFLKVTAPYPTPMGKIKKVLYFRILETEKIGRKQFPCIRYIISADTYNILQAATTTTNLNFDPSNQVSGRSNTREQTISILVQKWKRCTLSILKDYKKCWEIKSF